ncbi:hypothetical protein BDV96DRAFT_673997 [Lophiotrema nucula]|uniref:Uncharacterized protein n=1 Tax=Lophiotrema nucula TaxID=690887 RepID=A0A6A5ZN11_9PLEO|nr:hypothetical protein BDV96DRAFT_673997 [Lophiotrema nucula]
MQLPLGNLLRMITYRGTDYSRWSCTSIYLAAQSSPTLTVELHLSSQALQRLLPKDSPAATAQATISGTESMMSVPGNPESLAESNKLSPKPQNSPVALVENPSHTIAALVPPLKRPTTSVTAPPSKRKYTRSSKRPISALLPLPPELKSRFSDYTQTVYKGKAELEKQAADLKDKDSQIKIMTDKVNDLEAEKTVLEEKKATLEQEKKNWTKEKQKLKCEGIISRLRVKSLETTIRSYADALDAVKPIVVEEMKKWEIEKGESDDRARVLAETEFKRYFCSQDEKTGLAGASDETNKGDE